jgi:hypothetical protein
VQCAVSRERVQFGHWIKARAATVGDVWVKLRPDPWPFSRKLTANLIFLNDSRRRLCATINNNQKTEREAAMRQFMMTVMALVAFGATVATAEAENQTPQTARPSQVKRAASKATSNSYDVCAKKALDLGFIAGQAGRRDFIYQCMGGSPNGMPHN